MSILDRSIPYRSVLMVLPRKRIEKEKSLHPDYTYIPYSDEYFQAWCQLHTSTGLFETLEKAQECLTGMLVEDQAFFEDNFLFVVDQDGHLVGSAGLWPGQAFEVDRLRVHYVSVDEKAQHKGIASSMVSKLAIHYDSIPNKYPLYLSTQSQSYAAIALYAKLGFTPYLGAYKGHTKEESEADWQFITTLLKERG